MISSVLPELEYESWLGLLAPRGLPPRVLERLNREMRAVLATAAVAARIKDLGAIPRPVSPEEFKARCEREIARFKQIVAARRIPQE